MNPILVDLGFFQIRYYGLMYAIGLLLGIFLAKKDLRKMKVKYSFQAFENIIFFSFFFGILGGRLYYVIFNLNYYFSANVPWYEPLAIWKGGLAIHGGLLGAILGAWLSGKKFKIPFLVVADISVPYILLAQALGRIGNFMNGDAHGSPTDLPWGLVFKYGPASQEFPNQALHPVMLYELFLNLIGFFVLLKMRKQNFRYGFILCCYFIFYGAIRSLVTIFRVDDLYFLGLRAPHLFSLISLFFVLYFIYSKQLYKRDNPIYN